MESCQALLWLGREVPTRMRHLRVDPEGRQAREARSRSPLSHETPVRRSEGRQALLRLGHGSPLSHETPVHRFRRSASQALLRLGHKFPIAMRHLYVGSIGHQTLLGRKVHIATRQLCIGSKGCQAPLRRSQSPHRHTCV